MSELQKFIKEFSKQHPEFVCKRKYWISNKRCILLDSPTECIYMQLVGDYYRIYLHASNDKKLLLKKIPHWRVESKDIFSLCQ